MPALVTESTKTKIPSLLAERGQSLTWLCRKIGLSRSYVWMMENGRRPISSEYVGKAAEVLGVPADLLFTDSNTAMSDSNSDEQAAAE